jgi:hypothetical protein
MQRLLADLAARRERTAFPGRIRIIAAPGRETELATMGWTAEWPGADACEAIAGLGGSAYAEQSRGGLVSAVVDATALADGTAMPALIATAKLGVPCLLGVVAPSTHERNLVESAGWTWVNTADGIHRPSAMAISADAATSTVNITRGRWAPVHMAGLRSWARRTEMDPLVDLTVLADTEPRLLLAHAMAPWRILPPTGASLAALAALAGEGRRVCWHLPPSFDVQASIPILQRMAERGRAMTLVVDHLQTTDLGFWSTLPSWWVNVAADARELRALLARALAAEELTVIGRPMISASLAWQLGTAHEPGAGRWLKQENEAKATIACAGVAAPAALAAAESLAVIGIPIDVFHVTSLQPLPEDSLRSSAERGPLIVVDDGDPTQGLAGAMARLGISVHPVGHGPLAADLAAAIRNALTGR